MLYIIGGGALDWGYVYVVDLDDLVGESHYYDGTVKKLYSPYSHAQILKYIASGAWKVIDKVEYKKLVTQVVRYNVGNIFIIDNQDYILARINQNSCLLISLKYGNRFKDGFIDDTKLNSTFFNEYIGYEYTVKNCGDNY